VSDEKKKVLVVGDIMVDRYMFVNTSRQAPEAPIPVWDHAYSENRLGGAANTAHNVKALGGEDVEVFLAGIVDSQDKKMISRLGIDTILCAGFETMRKTRYIDEKNSKIIFRCDDRLEFGKQSVESFELCLQHFMRGHMFDVVIFSDYNKGTITKNVVDLVVPCTKMRVVDSKRLNLSMFRGMDLLKVNEAEYGVQGLCSAYPYVEALFDYVVVTKGSKGAQLRQAERGQEEAKEGVVNLKYVVHAEDFPSISVRAIDVTGCGDTHTAAMAFSLLKNNDLRLAVKFANECARNVVQKFGTSVVSR
jgi:D-beta-D-heptose 7-phosphate kinase/D-beta-D-heptose 1-phosphate adenosyltransferase